MAHIDSLLPVAPPKTRHSGCEERTSLEANRCLRTAITYFRDYRGSPMTRAGPTASYRSGAT